MSLIFKFSARENFMVDFESVNDFQNIRRIKETLTIFHFAL